MKLAHDPRLPAAIIVLLLVFLLPPPLATGAPPPAPAPPPALPSPAPSPPPAPIVVADFTATPLLPARHESLDILGPGLLATCAPQSHKYFARCQAAHDVQLKDLSGRPVGPALTIKLGDRTEKFILLSTVADPARPDLTVKWGLITTDGLFLVKPTWDRLQFLGPGVFAYRVDTKCPAAKPGTKQPASCPKSGIFNLNQKRTYPADFESIQPDNAAPYAVRKTGGKHGYIDDHGRMIVPFLYDSAARCSDGLCRATLGRDTVYFDTTGKKMLTVAMNADVFSEGMAIVQAPGFKFGFIDRTGKLAIPAIYQAAEDFHGGFAAVQRAGKWGYIDRTGKTVVPFKWTEAGDFSDGFARVTLETFGTKGQTLSTDTAILNAHGKTLWRVAGRFNYYLDSGFPVVSDPEKERYGVVDPQSGHLVVPMKHKYVSVSGQGLIVIGDDASRVALLDRKGAVILPIADRTVEFNVAGVLVSTGGAKPSARLYDATGRKAITTTTYDELGGWWTSVPHLGTFRRGATGGLMDARGRETCTVPGASDGAFVTNATPVLVHRYYKRWSTGAFTHHFASDGLVKFKVNGKWGLYDFHCRVVSAPSWEDIGLMREWMVPVKSAGKWGLLKITARPPALDRVH